MRFWSIWVLVLGVVAPLAANPNLRDMILNIQYELSNQDDELNTLRERLENQEHIIDIVRQDSEKVQSHSRDLVKDTLTQYQSRLQTLESHVEQQGKTLAALETAVRALVETLQTPDNSKPTPVAEVTETTIYRVVDGDSLGTIAKKHHTTIRKLKELNNLTSDRIIIGQKLKIPTAEAS